MPISLEHVSYEYTTTDGGRVPAVTNLDMTFRDGAISSIVGPSGCGKSTILSLIIGLLKPVAGLISISFPHPVKSNIKFGISFQNPALLSWKTVRSNIQLPILLHPEANVPESKVDEILTLMGLASFQNSFPHELSGGMQIRASLGRALVMDPPFVLLDEPFGALDEKTSLDMMNLIRTINERLAISFVVVTHNVLQAVFLSDFVFTLSPHPGRLLNEYAVQAPKARSFSAAKVLSLAQQIRADLGIKDA